MKVLLVEDEKKIREGLAAMMEQAVPGLRVAGQAENGKEALEWLKTRSADVVVTDIRMGDVDGIELMKRLRALYPRMPIVIVSGYGDFEYAKAAIRHGVADYLLKPVNKVELAAIMTRLYKEWEAREGIVAEESEDAGQGKMIIRKAKALIQQSLGEELSLQYLADRLFVHPKYLSMVFKKETGQNLSDYVTACRIDKAKELITETNLKIMEIANLCGFQNYRYFMTVFKQRTGRTPTEFRNR